MGVLEGVKVLSFGQVAQAPWAAQLLGDLGADIIKVEHPKGGDLLRRWSQGQAFVGGESVSFLSYNRNKRSIAVDLKSEAGQQVIYRLAADTDILIENFRPGVMERLGLGYDKLSEINPGIVYCRTTGYGSDGPYSKMPAFDMALQGFGVATLNGRADDPPIPTGINAIDGHSALLLAFVATAALLYRDKTGQGQLVEGCLLNAAIDLQQEQAAVFLNAGISPERSKTGLGIPYAEPPYGIYKTKDGFISIGLIPVAKLAGVTGCEELSRFDSPKRAFRNRDRINELLNRAFAQRITEEWLESLQQEDIPCSPVKYYEELFQDPQVLHNEIIDEVDHPTAGPIRLSRFPVHLHKTPATIRMPPPLLGEHTREILREHGYSNGEIDELESEAIISCGGDQVT